MLRLVSSTLKLNTFKIKFNGATSQILFHYVIGSETYTFAFGTRQLAAEKKLFSIAAHSVTSQCTTSCLLMHFKLFYYEVDLVCIYILQTFMPAKRLYAGNIGCI